MNYQSSLRDGQAFLLLTIAALLWAGNFVIGRALNGLIDPFSLNYLRWCIAGIALLPVLVRHWGMIQTALASHFVHLCVLALLAIVLFNWILYVGLQHTSGSIAGLVFGLTPLMIIFIASCWNGRAPTLWELLGGVIAFAGLSFVVLDSLATSAPDLRLLGALIVFGASAIWATYTVCLRRLSVPLPPMPCLAAIVWLGLLILTPVALLRGVPNMAPITQGPILASVLYLGLGASVIALCAWQAGVARIGAIRSSIFLQLIPFFGIVLSALFLDEALTPTKIAGLAALVGGVWLSQRGAPPPFAVVAAPAERNAGP
jgi:drug/metabolite transporter (DMT)-like permease